MSLWEKATKYVVTKDIKVNDEYTIAKGNHLLIDWDGHDGAWWKCIEDGHYGCPFGEINSIEVIK